MFKHLTSYYVFYTTCPVINAGYDLGLTENRSTKESAQGKTAY